jgi:hypothetical protein
MAEVPLPGHVVTRRRDGRHEVLLHRSLAVIGEDKIEIKSARSTVVLPLLGLLISVAVGYWMGTAAGGAPIWVFVIALFFLLFAVPISVMALVGSIAGADVIIDAKKGSATWQQGYLGMGIGTKELVPFHKIDHLEITIEGDQADRWHDHRDDLRQFALRLVKVSGKVLPLAQIPVPADDQTDGMDRTLAVANAIAALTGSTVTLPEGWELVEIDLDTGEPVPAKAAPTRPRKRKPRR